MRLFNIILIYIRKSGIQQIKKALF